MSTPEQAKREHVAGLFEELGVTEGATLQTIQRTSGVNTANAMRLMALFYAVRSATPPESDARVRALVEDFVERCREIRHGSPNAFYAHVDRFCAAIAALGLKEA